MERSSMLGNLGKQERERNPKRRDLWVEKQIHSSMIFLKPLKSNDKSRVKWNLINDKKNTWEEALL